MASNIRLFVHFRFMRKQCIVITVGVFVFCRLLVYWVWIEKPMACTPLMEDICTPSTDPLPPPSYAEVQKKDRRHRVAKRIVVCCVVVVALAIGWCIPGPAYIRISKTNTREVYVTHTSWILPTRSSKCATITRTIPQTVYVTSTQVQTVTRYIKPTPSPTEKPVCPYTYPAGYKDGRKGGRISYWSPQFRSDQDYMQGYFEGYYNYVPYCISSQLSF